MKKIIYLLFTLCLTAPLAAAGGADNIFTRALQDEMQRTRKELRLKGSPDPFFIGYYLFDRTKLTAKAKFGQITAYPTPTSAILGTILLSAGNAKNDSWGLHNKRTALYFSNIPRSYGGIRQALWELSDAAYARAIEDYDAKVAFKRKKNITGNLTDFLPAKKIIRNEPVTAPELLTDAELAGLARELSDWGADKPFVEDFNVEIVHAHDTTYYLNSEGSAYQKSDTELTLTWRAQIRNRAGYVQAFKREARFVALNAQTRAQIAEISQHFREALSAAYAAKKAESYLGPVLLKPAAASWLLTQEFVKNISNLKPLLDTQYQKGGNFRDKTGKRVMSNLITVYDKPQLRQYNNQPLYFTAYFDDEGVPAQELILAQGGKIKELPRSRRPLEKGAQSNGHGFSPDDTLSFPREGTTNVWVEAVQPQTPQALEEQLLAQCRALEMEYCLIVNDLPRPLGAWRIYSADGHKEPVFGLELTGLSTRALRDITGAGNDLEVTDEGRMVTPSLLLEELEFIPTNEEPDTPPFVPKPAMGLKQPVKIPVAGSFIK